MNAQASKALSLSSAPSRMSRAQVGGRRTVVPERARASERSGGGRKRETENRMRAEPRGSIARSIFFIGAPGLDRHARGVSIAIGMARGKTGLRNNGALIIKTTRRA